jgi:hypothetical protein
MVSACVEFQLSRGKHAHAQFYSMRCARHFQPRRDAVIAPSRRLAGTAERRANPIARHFIPHSGYVFFEASTQE